MKMIAKELGTLTGAGAAGGVLSTALQDGEDYMRGALTGAGAGLAAGGVYSTLRRSPQVREAVKRLYTMTKNFNQV